MEILYLLRKCGLVEIIQVQIYFVTNLDPFRLDPVRNVCIPTLNGILTLPRQLWQRCKNYFGVFWAEFYKLLKCFL